MKIQTFPELTDVGINQFAVITDSLSSPAVMSEVAATKNAEDEGVQIGG